MTLGERLAELRDKANLTRVQVGKMIGVAEQTIFKYETGIVTNIPLSKIQLLADLYCVTPAYIIGWDEENKETEEKNAQISKARQDLFDLASSVPEEHIAAAQELIKVYLKGVMKHDD